MLPWPQCPAGLTGVQTIVPVMLDHVNARRLSLGRMVDLMCAGPARVYGAIGKGRIAAGYDAGVRYDERLERDMIAVPIGPRVQRFATAASPAYLDARGRPEHPRDLLKHSCLRGQFASGAIPTWEFERDGETVRIDLDGPLLVRLGAAVDLAVAAAIDGLGVIHLFEGWLQPYLDRGALEPVLEPWWQTFSGPFLYYPGRRHLPSPLRAFVDFVKSH